jgi:hypothetical protein
MRRYVHVNFTMHGEFRQVAIRWRGKADVKRVWALLREITAGEGDASLHSYGVLTARG